ncbi:MAG: hypothetical protein ACP6IP_04385 [Candidatus Njordarchaeia archaeon]
MKREDILNKKVIGYVLLIAIFAVILFAPWMDIELKYKRALYQTEGQTVYISDGLGSAIFVNKSIIAGQEIANQVVVHQQPWIQAYVTPFLILAVALLVIQLVIVLMKKTFDNPVLSYIFNEKGELPPLTVLFASLFLFLGSVIMYLMYPTMYIYNGHRYISINQFVSDLANFAVHIPNADRLAKYFTYKPGWGAEAGLFMGIIMLSYYFYKLLNHVELRKTWRLRGTVFFIDLLVFISPIAVYQNADTIGVLFGFSYFDGIEYAILAAIGLGLMLFYRFFTTGKVLIMDIQFLSLDLPPDEYRKRLEIVRKYSPFTKIINGVINLILLAQFAISIVIVYRLINYYNALKYVNIDKFTYLYATFIPPLNTVISAWFLWALPLITLSLLLIVVD